MAAPKKRSRAAVIPLSAEEKADLVKFRESLDEVGRELFDIAMSVPKEELMSTEEILAEIAWPRGGITAEKPTKPFFAAYAKCITIYSG